MEVTYHCIYDYPYARIEFYGDTDMPLPLGSAYRDIGKIPFVFFELFYFFLVFLIYLEIKNMFLVVSSTDIKFMCTDVGP